MEYKFTNKKKEIKIEKSNKKDIKFDSIETTDDIVLDSEIKKSVYCRTIKAFTKRFPNLVKYQQIVEKTEKNFIDIENDFKLINKLKNYFNLIKEYLLGKNNYININLIASKELEDILDKIYDFIMEKLFDKLVLKDFQI